MFGRSLNIIIQDLHHSLSFWRKWRVSCNILNARKNMKRLPGPRFGGQGGFANSRQLEQQVMDSNFGAPARNLTARNTLHRLASS